MIAKLLLLPPVLVAGLAGAAHSQGEQPAGFAAQAAAIQRQLEESTAELSLLRQELIEQKVPLTRELNGLEADLSRIRDEYQQATRLLERNSLDLSNLQAEVKARSEEKVYITNLIGEYLRNLETGLHIAEMSRYRDLVAAARLAPENPDLSPAEVFQKQADLLAGSLDRLHEAAGGVRFPGHAVDATGLVKPGTFVLLGPTALFLADDGSAVGTAQPRLGSLEPSILPFANPAGAEAARSLIATNAGAFPFDPTLGNAHKIEATKESIVEHIQKGGPVMVPILGMAAAALLVALYKWIALALIRRPSRRQVHDLMQAVGMGDHDAARERARDLKGPMGRMLAAGVQHLGESKALLEEVMYEVVLTAKLRIQRLLPFIAICAAAAPLLGLLGTVTGIINTFKLITVFGSGDVKTLSSGISEALITTEFGLIVAIPSLLIHSFLSRKARGIVGQMETAAVALVNQAGQARLAAPAAAPPGAPASAPDPGLVRQQVQEILKEILDPLAKSHPAGHRSVG